MSTGVRTAALGLWDTYQFAKTISLHCYEEGAVKSRGQLSKIFNARAYLGYAVDVWSRRKKLPINVEALVQCWVRIIAALATAHTKDEIDAAEFSMDEALGPILTAPVAQIREFYASLTAALRGDPKIPLFVWSAFEAWHEVVVKKAPDEDVKALKTELAGEIAELVEKDPNTIPDIRAAMIGALQWRAPEQLEKVRDSLKAGNRPRIKGRESCLFLQAGDATVML